MPAVAHADTTEFQHLSSLYRLLKRAVATRSEREILRTFIEALAVWQDAESMAYVADVTGRFVLDVLLPGSDRGSVPAILDVSHVPSDATTFRLPPAEREAMGFHGQADVILSRIRGRATSDWLIASRAPADSLAEARLSVYVEAVSQALSEMTAIESSRLTWAMLQHLLPTTDAPDRAAQGAVDALAAAIEGDIVLAVLRADGSRALAVGDPKEATNLDPSTRSPRALVLTVEAPPPFTARIGVVRRGDRPLTGRDERLLGSAASTVGAWLGMVSARLHAGNERRSGPRSFDRVVERQAKEARTQQRDLTVLVVLLGAEAPEHHSTQACVAHIRGQLRPGDMAGRLSSGHIGVVLPDTTHEGASIVAARLRRLVTSALECGPIPDASVVFASPPIGPSAAQAQLRDVYDRVLGDLQLMPGPPN